MNPYSGDIERFVKPEEAPKGWLQLTDAEAKELEALPKMMRIERYIKTHREDKCVTCGRFVGHHTAKKFVDCAASELSKLEVKRLEDQMNPVLTP